MNDYNCIICGGELRYSSPRMRYSCYESCIVISLRFDVGRNEIISFFSIREFDNNDARIMTFIYENVDDIIDCRFISDENGSRIIRSIDPESIEDEVDSLINRAGFRQIMNK